MNVSLTPHASHEQSIELKIGAVLDWGEELTAHAGRS